MGWKAALQIPTVIQNHKHVPYLCARGTFDNSPQFQLRIRGAQTESVPAGRLSAGLPHAVGCIA